MPNIRLKLSPTKQVIAQNASQIYSAYVASGVAEGDRKKALKRAIEESILIARTVDDSLQSDAELPAPERTPSDESGEPIPLSADGDIEAETPRREGGRGVQQREPVDAGEAAAEVLFKTR